MGRTMAVCVLAIFLGAGLLFGGAVTAAEKTGKVKASSKEEKKKIEHKKAFAIYQKKCLGCHDSVADPEKPGKTRDDWHLVVNVMHGYGLDLTPQEDEAITELLYQLRKGLEKDAG